MYLPKSHGLSKEPAETARGPEGTVRTATPKAVSRSPSPSASAGGYATAATPSKTVVMSGLVVFSCG